MADKQQQLLQYGGMTREQLPEWIRARLGSQSPGRGTAQVLTRLHTHPRQMSFASTAEAAQLAGVNAATVVRAAQLLGFSGWPPLRSEMRSRYLSGLSASEVLAEHDAGRDGPAWATLRRDVRNLQELALTLDEEQIARVAQTLAAARVTLVLGSGSFAAPGLMLAHLAQTIGHDVRLHRAGGTSLFNAISLLGEGDALVVFHLWRTPTQILNAMAAAPPGVRVILVGDQARSDLVELSDELVLIPSEGSSMFPSLVAAVTVAQATIAALVAIDGPAAAAASDRAEQLWTRYGVFPDTNELLQ